MKAAIFENDIQQLADEIRDAHRAHTEAATKLETARDAASRRRIELGQVLIRARKRWPRSGPKAKGWGELLEMAGLDQDVALDAMKYAGFVEDSSPGDEPGKLPTMREAGIDNRPQLALVPPADDKPENAPDASDAPAPDRETWCTPGWITEAIGKFDLDPCSNERSTVRSDYTYRLDRGEDGLALAPEVPARYKVYLNPPYSDVMPWVKAYKHARFCFLLKFDNSTKWFEELIGSTAVVLFPKRTRIEFVPPDGVEASSNPFPHALFYAREDDVTTAIRRLCFEFWRKR